MVANKLHRPPLAALIMGITLAVGLARTCCATQETAPGTAPYTAPPSAAPVNSTQDDVRYEKSANGIAVENGLLRFTISGDYSNQGLYLLDGGTEQEVLRSPFLLLQRHGGFGDLEPLKGNKVRLLFQDRHRVCFEVCGENACYTYGVTFNLGSGERFLTGRVRFKPKVNQVGWFCYGLEAAKQDDHWCYPWVSGKRLRIPTDIGRSIGFTRPNHIWTALTGVPAIEGSHGDCMYAIGFPVDFDYRNCSLTYNNELDSSIRLCLGLGRVKGADVEDALEEFSATGEYEFPFQVVLARGGWRDLALAWCRANSFVLDDSMRYSPDALANILIEGRQGDERFGTPRYIDYVYGGTRVSGYAHGSDDTRICLNRQSRNAYVDYLLFLKTKDAKWRERAFRQLDFLVASQTPQGPYRENWDFVKHQYYFQGLDGFGFHPDYQALICEYLVKCCDQIEKHEAVDTRAWRQSAERALAWVVAQIKDDGSVPQTITMQLPVQQSSAGNMADASDAALRDCKAGPPVPMTRLLCALSYFYPTGNRKDLEAAMLKHEAWVVENAYKDQCWWGHWADTDQSTTVYAGLKFIEYCSRRYEQTRDPKYLEWGSETAYWSFFAMVPKQLPWLTHYCRGAVIEQDNYMQFNNCIGDGLTLSSLEKLSQWSGDSFLHDLARQCYQTACHSPTDDPRHPWYGAANMCVTDSMGFAVPFDTDPATGGATKYAGEIVCSLLEDMWISDDLGLFRQVVPSEKQHAQASSKQQAQNP